MMLFSKIRLEGQADQKQAKPVVGLSYCIAQIILMKNTTKSLMTFVQHSV